MNVLRKFSLIAAVLAAFASLPAAAQKVETDYDHSVNLSQFHTYSWGHVHSSDPFVEARICEDVDRVLQARGWQKVPNSPSLESVVYFRPLGEVCGSLLR